MLSDLSASAMREKIKLLSQLFLFSAPLVTNFVNKPYYIYIQVERRSPLGQLALPLNKNNGRSELLVLQAGLLGSLLYVRPFIVSIQSGNSGTESTVVLQCLMLLAAFPTPLGRDFHLCPEMQAVTKMADLTKFRQST